MGTRSADPRSIKRAGLEVRRLVREDTWTAVRRHRWLLVQLALFLLVLAVATGFLTRFLGGDDLAVGFVVGAVVGTVPFFGLTFLVGQGLAHRSMGADAEQWTAGELAKLDRRRWTVFHDVPMEYGNIDHLAVGPGRVYAIETKWTARSDMDRFLNGASRQAERQACDLESVLSARGAGREVIPLLVVWGPGTAAVFEGKPRMIGQTRAVHGGDAEDWLGRMNGALDSLEIDRPARMAIEAHLADHAREPSAATA